MFFMDIRTLLPSSSLVQDVGRMGSAKSDERDVVGVAHIIHTVRKEVDMQNATLAVTMECRHILAILEVCRFEFNPRFVWYTGDGVEHVNPLSKEPLPIIYRPVLALLARWGYLKGQCRIFEWMCAVAVLTEIVLQLHHA